MVGGERGLVVGVLGQWASGKSTAARTIIEHLGGEDKVNFITDRELLAQEAVNHLKRLEDSERKLTILADGRQRIEGKLSTVYLGPEEDLNSVDLSALSFDLHNDVYDNIAPGEYGFLDLARIEVGKQIQRKSAEGKPIVIEAGFGTNQKPKGLNPFSHTINDLFSRLAETGVKPGETKWVIIEASYKKRVERNRKRPDKVPELEFNRFAADGGDLTPSEQRDLENQGTKFKRVPNDHDDIEKFQSDIVAALEELIAKAQVREKRSKAS